MAAMRSRALAGACCTVECSSVMCACERPPLLMHGLVTGSAAEAHGPSAFSSVAPLSASFGRRKLHS